MTGFFDNKNIFLTLSYICNAFCKKCMTRHNIKKDIQMSFTLLNVVLEKIKCNNYLGIISLGSGEPLLYPHFNYLMSSVLNINNNISLRILSNGMAFNDTIPADFFCPRCKWGITMDGFTQHSLQGFQAGVKIDTVKENITKIVKTYGPECLYLNYTMHNKNYHELPDFCRFAASLGIADVYVTELKVYELYEERLRLYRLKHSSDVKAAIEEARRILDKYGISSKGLEENSNQKSGCFLRRAASPIIDVDGAVTFCSGREDIEIGNILDKDIDVRWRKMKNDLSSQIETWCQFCHSRQLSNGTYSLPRTIDRESLSKQLDAEERENKNDKANR